MATLGLILIWSASHLCMYSVPAVGSALARLARWGRSDRPHGRPGGTRVGCVARVGRLPYK